MTPPSSDFVTLAPGPTGGLTVPLDAYNLAHELLTQRGLLLVEVGDKLRVRQQDGSAPILSADDQARIRKWKVHLLALLAYQAPPMGQTERGP